MSAGTVQTILVCQPSGTPDNHIPCPSGTGAVAVQAYVIDAASQDFFDSVVVPFDAAQAGTFFMVAFCTTIFIAWVTWQGGEVLDMVKRILGIRH